MTIINPRIFLRLSKEARAWREAVRRSPESAHLTLINRRARMSKRYYRRFRKKIITGAQFKSLNKLLFKPFKPHS